MIESAGSVCEAISTSSVTLGARLDDVRLAEPVLLAVGREAAVGVGRADHAELERVGAELGLELQAELERFARVLELQHLRRLGLGAREVALVDQLEIGEFVVRREEAGGLRRCPWAG